MNLASAPQKAQDVSSEKQAARLYNSVESELAFSDNEDDYDAGEQALKTLEDRFPGVADQAHQVTEPPSLSRRAGDQAYGHQGRRRSGGGRGGPSSHRASRARNRTSPRARGARAPGLSDITGVSGGDVTDTLLTGLRYFLLAAVGYQLLTPKGSGALSTVFGDLGSGLQKLIQPVDPLAAIGKPADTGKNPASAFPPGHPPANKPFSGPGSVAAATGIPQAGRAIGSVFTHVTGPLGSHGSTLVGAPGRGHIPLN